MYTERFSIEFVCGVLIAAAERKRLALGPWTPAAREELRAVFRAELAAIEPRFFEVFDDRRYFDHLEQTAMDVCFPRYCAVAEKQTALEQHGYRLWRGGDLLARLAYMAGGLAFGLFVVKTPWVPVPETWDFLILASMLGAPFIPDAQVALHKRRYSKALQNIVKDIHEAEETHRLYEPLGTDPTPERRDELVPPETTSPESDRSRPGVRER